ncbi:MAG: 4Fe-4S dicluster domain-containing protein, partial [Candidatus Neomarinimicrobiota bacterium]|nr:4Fe-4S dicluster domain-containing protein [Candidatus Neomarinimicrobiota bacterium]
GGNPVYNAPADLKFESLIKNVQNIVHLSNIYDETSKHSNWHIAESHFFESWGDAMSYDGYPSVIQPQIRPLFQSHTAIDLLIPIIYGEERSSYDFIREVWKSNIIRNSNFEKQWNKVLHDGVHQKPLLKAHKAVSSKKLSTASLNTKLKVKSDKFEVVFIASPSTYDGRYANNGWLQEVPKPITQLTWDNAALISMSVAKKLKIKNGQMLEISLDGKTMNIPAWIVPGQNKKTITIELGYGRDFNGRIGNSVGFNAYTLRTMATMAYGVNASIKVLNKTYPLAGTQDHYGLEEDSLALLGNTSGTDSIQKRIPELVRQSTLDYYKDHPNFVQDAVKEHKPDKSRTWADHSMYNPEPEYDYTKGQQWGMSIDLTSCTGCNACSISCQSENNIPIVGKQQVLNGREMHWIRIDNYFSGDPENPEVSSQSVACVHCELAPCEQVCPVAATTHSSDGVNQMTYNRCLGTRYCANNCPYKVRKFNFYNFTKDTPEIVQMAMNPDVTVRFRGVMEKCSYCYQRVSEARIKAENEHREMIDGDVKTACQEACPADAIVFGDINDPNSNVSKAKRNNRDYALLGQLGTAPRTTYLAKIRNQNPKLITSHNTGAHH